MAINVHTNIEKLLIKMGCSPSKSHYPKSASIQLESFPYQNVRNMSTALLDQGSSLSPCLKIIIKEDDVEKWQIMKEMLKEFAFEIYEQCMEIYLIYTNLTCTLAHFESLVHGVCIVDYDIIKGFDTLLIFLEINNKALIRKFIPPKFQIFESKEIQNDHLNKIFMAWNELINLIGNNDNSLKLTQNSKEISSLLVKFTGQNIKRASSFFKLASRYLSLSDKTNERLKELQIMVNDYMKNYKFKLSWVRKVAKLNMDLKGLEFSIFVHNYRTVN